MSLLPFLKVLPCRQLPSPTGLLSSSLASSAIEEANAVVTSVREEAAAKKRGHHHHLSASVRAAIGKCASKNGNSATARHFSSDFVQLVSVLKIIIAKILSPYKNSVLIKNFNRQKFPAIRYSHT